MFVATKDRVLPTTTTGALPRPSWYTENVGGRPLSVGFSQRAYREQHLDCLAANVAMQHRAGIDIMVDGDCRLDDDWAGRSWVAYPLERIEGIGPAGLEVQPAGFLSDDRGPGDLIWEVVETRLTPHVTAPIGETGLELDRAYKAMAAMTDRACKDRFRLGPDPDDDGPQRPLPGPGGSPRRIVGRPEPGSTTPWRTPAPR